MLSLEDCIAMSDLTAEEIEAIAMHEHIPIIVAAELGNYLTHKHGGPMRICKMIMDDIDQAYQHKDSLRVARLKVTLKHFIEAHQKEIAEDGL
jgi:hypothetical protein